MKQTYEAAFETAIESLLLNDGYHQLPSSAFDTECAIFPDEALAFIRETQAKIWEKLTKPCTVRRPMSGFCRPCASGWIPTAR
jgi:hypothetical protein